MFNLKILRVGAVVLTLLLLVMVSTVSAGELASFDNPTLAACNLNGLSVSGTLTIGDTVYVEEYLNGRLRNTFKGNGGRYSGYVTRFNTGEYPYTFATTLNFKNSSGALIEQYAIEGDCTAEDTGSVSFREVAVDAAQQDTGMIAFQDFESDMLQDTGAAVFQDLEFDALLDGSLASFDNPTLAACNLNGLSVSGTLTIGTTVYVEEYLNGNLRNTFTGQGGRYSGYVTRFSTDSYPYSFATVLSFKNTSGAIIEQYSIEGACTAEDTGSVQFREIAVDAMAGQLAKFENLALATCSLNGLSVSGTLTIGATVYVEEYLNGNLRNTFTGQGGRYSGYVTRFNVASYPYTFATVLTFKNSSGEIIEQYIIEGECTAEDTGSINFREVELDAQVEGIS